MVVLAAVPARSCQRCKKCPGERSGCGRVLDSGVTLNAEVGWTVPQWLVNRYRCSCSPPSFRGDPVCQAPGVSFVLSPLQGAWLPSPNNHYFAKLWSQGGSPVWPVQVTRYCRWYVLRANWGALPWPSSHRVVEVVIPRLKALNQIWMWKHGIAGRKCWQKVLPSSKFEVFICEMYVKERRVKHLCSAKLCFLAGVCCHRSCRSWGGGQKKRTQTHKQLYYVSCQQLGVCFFFSLHTDQSIRHSSLSAFPICLLRDLSSFGPKVSLASET